MECGFCGHRFDSAAAVVACHGCPLVKGCHLVRCPRCGYEMPPESKLLAWLRQRGKREHLSKSSRRGLDETE